MVVISWGPSGDIAWRFLPGCLGRLGSCIFAISLTSGVFWVFPSESISPSASLPLPSSPLPLLLSSPFPSPSLHLPSRPEISSTVCVCVFFCSETSMLLFAARCAVVFVSEVCRRLCIAGQSTHHGLPFSLPSLPLFPLFPCSLFSPSLFSPVPSSILLLSPSLPLSPSPMPSPVLSSPPSPPPNLFFFLAASFLSLSSSSSFIPPRLLNLSDMQSVVFSYCCTLDGAVSFEAYFGAPWYLAFCCTFHGRVSSEICVESYLA